MLIWADMICFVGQSEHKIVLGEENVGYLHFPLSHNVFKIIIPLDGKSTNRLRKKVKRAVYVMIIISQKINSLVFFFLKLFVLM